MPMARIILVAVVMAVAETAWALFCAVAQVNLALFYAVLVAASTVFWIPGLAEPRQRPPTISTSPPETNR